MKKKLVIISGFLLFPVIAAGFFWLFYPGMHRFLVYSDLPDHADTMILYIGPEFRTRLKEAICLVNEGYSDWLIIPAYQKIYSQADLVGGTLITPGKSRLSRQNYPVFYENTHIETLEAKKMMAAAGFESAIFISSPYHMRRVRLIAATVFSDKTGTYKFVGSRFEREPAGIGLYDWDIMKNVFMEYMKTAVFLIYRLF